MSVEHESIEHESIEHDELYDLVTDAVKQALAEEAGGDRIRMHKRLVEGRVDFVDGEGRTVKQVPIDTVFRKVTAIREKLRVLEQKLNNHPGLSESDKAELQGYVTRSYGSLTTFNFLFRDEVDYFKGAGG